MIQIFHIVPDKIKTLNKRSNGRAVIFYFIQLRLKNSTN